MILFHSWADAFYMMTLNLIIPNFIQMAFGLEVYIYQNFIIWLALWIVLWTGAWIGVIGPHPKIW